MIVSSRLIILYFTVFILPVYLSNISNTASNKYINISFIKLSTEPKLESGYHQKLDATNLLLKELNCEYLKMQKLAESIIKSYIEFNLKKVIEATLLSKKDACEKRCSTSESNCRSCAKLSKKLKKLLLKIKKLEEKISKDNSEYKRCLDIQYRYQVNGHKYVVFGIYTPRKCTKKEWLELSLSYNSLVTLRGIFRQVLYHHENTALKAQVVNKIDEYQTHKRCVVAMNNYIAEKTREIEQLSELRGGCNEYLAKMAADSIQNPKKVRFQELKKEVQDLSLLSIPPPPKSPPPPPPIPPPPKSPPPPPPIPPPPPPPK
ncbi:hypothetical protein ACR3K2_38010 [Cryptosporidium serpentis]